MGQKKWKTIDVAYLAVFLFLLYWIVLYKLYFLFNSPFDIFIEIYTIATSLFLLSRFVISVFYDDDHSEDHRIAESEYPGVSFVISCKNEEKSIGKTIDACLASHYPGEMECIAINDGSTDGTWKEMKRSKKTHGKALTIVNFAKNLGKREGMAEGVRRAKGEIVVFVDSDSFVEESSVKTIVAHFIREPDLGAASGNTLVENVDKNALTKMQSARYGVSYDVFKSCESVFGTVTCCPGCFSAYRRVAIMEVLDEWLNQKFLGTKSTFGDDRSLTNHILRKWRVTYCREAVATTIVPEKYSVLFKQQLRWKKSWVREGSNAARFFWKKNPIAAISFYTNLIIPIFGPLIVIRVAYETIRYGHSPVFFLIGVMAMSMLFGTYYYLIRPNKNWWYISLFTLLYTLVLIWQMPYALFKLKDTRWGTR